jgi:phosphoglycerate-specific signal transduction histidine kinase
MVDMLNRFAHRSDVEISSFSIGDVLEELCLLLQRTASTRKISLVSDCADRELRITNSPSLFQFLVYLLTTGLMDLADPGGEIRVTSVADGEGAAQIIIEAGNLQDTTGGVVASQAISLCAAELGVDIEERAGGHRARLAFRISSLV